MASQALVTPRIVRIRRRGGQIVQDCQLYIGRKLTMGGWNLAQSKWHNPYKVGVDGTLDEVCAKYYWYVRNGPLLNDLCQLSGLTLGCWCDIKDRPFIEVLGRPECHGQVLQRLFWEFCLTTTTQVTQTT